MSYSFDIELDREEDGRWIAEIPSLPGALAYGGTKDDAIAAVEALALRAVADRVEHREAPTSEPLSVSFAPAFAA